MYTNLYVFSTSSMISRVKIELSLTKTELNTVKSMLENVVVPAGKSKYVLLFGYHLCPTIAIDFHSTDI